MASKHNAASRRNTASPYTATAIEHSGLVAFGRYELVTLLARGGMAEVYLAQITGPGGFAKQLVIKRMLPHLAEDPEFVKMFLNEGRIAARLLHPNVCQVYESGDVEGAVFLAMEYLEGLSWGHLIPIVPRNGSFELRCTAGMMDQICEGLRYAHELNGHDGNPTPVVHRDVSPHNLMLTTSGVCKLLDFGVSKVITETSWTQAGILKGKLSYMAPEQIRGEVIDPRADVFSMGVVLWESLTGRRLFRRSNDYLIWRAVLEGDIPRVTSFQPHLPVEIDAVVARALERDPDRRYPTIRAFALDLRRVAALIGGPLDPRGLAAAVRALGGAALAERSALVSRALARSAPQGARPPLSEARSIPLPVPTTRVLDPEHAYSVHLHDAAIPPGVLRPNPPPEPAGSPPPIAPPSSAIPQEALPPTPPLVPTGSPPPIAPPGSAIPPGVLRPTPPLVPAGSPPPIAPPVPAIQVGHGQRHAPRSIAIGALAVISFAIVTVVWMTGDEPPASAIGPVTGSRVALAQDRTSHPTSRVAPTAGNPSGFRSANPSSSARPSSGGAAAGSGGAGGGIPVRDAGSTSSSAAPDRERAMRASASADGARTATGARPRDPSSKSAPLAAGVAERNGSHDGKPPAIPASTAPAVDTEAGRPRRHGDAPPSVETPAIEPGQYSVDSRPYATIFVDDQPYGDTPLYKIPLPPGTHQLRAVRIDGKVQHYAIEIQSGQLTSSGTLAW